MALAVRRPGYFVEPTPVTVRKLPHADDDIPPLPPIPEVTVTSVAQPSPPSFPWVFVLSLVVNLVLLSTLVRLAVGR